MAGWFSWILPEWLLALGLTLFLVDLFFGTDYISWAAVLALAGYTTWRFHPGVLWSVTIFLLSSVFWLVVYYAFFRELVAKIVRKTLVKSAPDDSVDRIVGAEGKIRIVEGTPFFLCNGEELLPIADTGDVWRENERARVMARKGAEVELEHI